MASIHSAAGQALGYAYQTRWPLLLMLRDDDNSDRLVRFEALEDVSLESADGVPSEAIQLKHHVAARTIGDTDPDLWKTITVWLDISDAKALGSGPSLVLVTTAVAQESSGLSLLRPVPLTGGRNEAEALSKLDTAARSSKNLATSDSRQRWLDLSNASRAALLTRVTVVDASPAITTIDQLVRDFSYKWLPAGHEDRFLDRLWGWWDAVALDSLANKRRGISTNELRLHINLLRDEYTIQSLPYDVTDADLTSYLDADNSGRGFYEQMKSVKATARQIDMAVRDYWRAVVQAHRWFKETLVETDELARYENRLIDEWEIAFEGALGRLPEHATDDDRRVAGYELLQSTLEGIGIRIRTGFDQPWFVRGKHHELADSFQIGWHPDFRTLFEDMIGRPA